MSNQEASQLPNYLVDPSRWYERAADGTVYLLDPLTGDPLRNTLPPVLVESDPELHAGLEYLRVRSNNIEVIDLYHLHEHETDLGDIDKSTFRDFVLAADYHGVEFMGASDADITQIAYRARLLLQRTLFTGFSAFRDEYEITNKSRLTDYERAISPFVTRLWYELAHTYSRTPSFNVDLHPGGTKLQGELNRLPAAWRDLAVFEKVILTKAFHNLRDWCMLGSLGLNVLKREMGQDPRSLKVTVNAGAGHIDKTRKGRALGLSVSPKFLQPARMTEREVYIQASSRIGRTSMIRPADLLVMGTAETVDVMM
jgi:hypothetical protein